MLSARYQLLCVILSFPCFFRQYVQSQEVAPIVIKGSKFFYQNNGSQFFIKGVIYQINYNIDSGTVAQNIADNTDPKLNHLADPLSSTLDCSQDVPYLKGLHVNVVRTYFIDTSEDHSNCMASFAQAGIYVMVDLITPGYLFNNLNPIWNNVLYNRYTSVIDSMHNYTNLLGFILGDDVVSGISQNDGGPYLKAAVRDMKAYIRQKSYRPIPVGSVNSVYGQDIFTFSDYLNCGDKSDENIDFWGANIRDWCCVLGISPSYTDSSYANATSALSAYPVPVFLAAYGCFQPSDLDFSEIDIIYGQLMSPVWSGGIFYEYFVDTTTNGSGYGLVDEYGVKASTYQNISLHLATVSPSSINSENYIPTNTAAACPVSAASSLPPNPTSVSLTTSSAKTSASSITPISSITPTPKASDDALSTGGKVGIGIGLTLLVLALVLGTYFIRKRAMKKKSIDRGPWTKTELEAEDVDREARGYGPHLADSTQRAEVDGSEVKPGVQADCSEIVEAPGDLPTLPELSGRHGEEIL